MIHTANPAKTSENKKYDLEDRTLAFAAETREFVNALPKSMANMEYVRQVLRSSGSVGANYIEANESLGKKDFALHIKISRKEAKESRYWLRLIETNGKTELEKYREYLIKEATELMKIFGAILRNSG